ncbi:cyclic 2,3-diphosphoglycerate synthase [Candidatus Woesearchaeota archaeon]|nr:cyclic 2,3-diphosphoglycerate synthase [Candidatus Woesearchaeota archaeon]
MRNVLILGAAGRDFHNFNTYYKDKNECNVVAFTAEQIPNISGRRYPAKLAGKQYPKGIPIFPESQLPQLIKRFKVDDVVLSYSDLSHIDVMHKASIANANGANFVLLSAQDTMLKSKKPVIAVCAVRTGCGKSPLSRKISLYYKKKGYSVAVVRHPMPYGDLVKQEWQRFETYSDLDKHKCTIEEREEYEPHINNGIIVYAGVNYQLILEKAEKEADIIIWDGGNNDTSFFKPDILFVVVDPHRPGHEITYYPGETNFRLADVIVINKVDTALKENIAIVKHNIKKFNPKAIVIDADSDIIIEDPAIIKGKEVLVVEDGPTLTHGGMTYGAGIIAARQNKAAKIIDPRKYATGSLKQVYEKFPHLTDVLPAMGYGKQQIKELEKTINKARCDLVIDGSPVNLDKLLRTNKPIISIRYEIKEKGKLKIESILSKIKVRRKK